MSVVRRTKLATIGNRMVIESPISKLALDGNGSTGKS